MDDRGHLGGILCSQCNNWNIDIAKTCVHCGKVLQSVYQTSSLFTKFCVLISIVNFFMLIIAIGYLPYTYYEILRWVVFVSSIILIIYCVVKVKTKSAILLAVNLYALLLLTFNPISSIHLDKGLWQIIDFFSAVLFILTGMAIYDSHTYSKYDVSYFIPVLIIGGILFFTILSITSGSYYDSPEEAFIQHQMLRECAISIFIFSTMGGIIFFGIRNSKQ
jgi:hypothetical protein